MAVCFVVCFSLFFIDSVLFSYKYDLSVTESLEMVVLSYTELQKA